MSQQYAIDVVKRVRYYVSYAFLHSDPEDGTAEGWYAFVSERPNDQSDFCLGPYASEKKARAMVPDRLANGMPKKKTAKCSSCFEPGMPRYWPSGHLRMYCGACMDK